MQARVRAGSRHNHLVLYDPAAIPGDLPVDPDLEAQDPKPLSKSAAREVASRGEGLILHIPGEDCDATLGLFVDEEPPEPILERGALVLNGARLSTPSGTLWADGLEFMARPGEVRKHAEPDVVAVPPGEYEIEVRELLSWKVRHRKSATRRGSGGRDRLAYSLITAYTWLGILLIPGNLLVAPGLVAVFWQYHGWRSGLQAAAVIFIIDAIVVGGFWLLEPLRKRFPALSRISEGEAAFDVENPDIAVILRLRPGTFRGGSPAFAEIRLRHERKRGA